MKPNNRQTQGIPKSQKKAGSLAVSFLNALILTLPLFLPGHARAGLDQIIGETSVHTNEIPEDFILYYFYPETYRYPTTRTISQGYNSGSYYSSNTEYNYQGTSQDKTTIKQEGNNLILTNNYLSDGNGSTGEETGLYIITRKHIYLLPIRLPCSGCREGGICFGGFQDLPVIYNEETDTYTTLSGENIATLKFPRSGGTGTCPCGPACGSSQNIPTLNGPPANNTSKLTYAGFLPAYKTLVWSKFYPDTPSPNPETTVIPIQNDWQGKELITITWKFRRYNHGEWIGRNQSPYINAWLGTSLTLPIKSTLSPGTSQNAEINLGQTFQPIYHDNPNASGEPAIEWQFKVQNQTNWQTQAWTPDQTGTYTFQVKKTSPNGTWNDSDPSGNYTLTVKKIDEVLLEIQTSTEVTITLGDTYVPDLPDETNDYKNVGTYELKPQGYTTIISPNKPLEWQPPLPGTYTLTLQHKGETIGNTEYLTSDLVTITLHVLQDHPPLVEGKRSTNTTNGAIPNGWYTYAGDTISLEITTTDPDHNHDLKFKHQISTLHYTLKGPDTETNGTTQPPSPDSNGRATTLITTQLGNKPGEYLIRAQAQDHSGLTSPVTEICQITVTEPYAYYRITASAKPATGLEAWFTPSGTTQQIIKLPRPRGPIQTQPNP